MDEEEKKAAEFYEKMRDIGDDHPVNCGTYCEGGTPDYNGIAKQSALIAQERVIDILTELQEHVNEESSDIIQLQIIEETIIKTLITGK